MKNRINILTLALILSVFATACTQKTVRDEVKSESIGVIVPSNATMLRHPANEVQADSSKKTELALICENLDSITSLKRFIIYPRVHHQFRAQILDRKNTWSEAKADFTTSPETDYDFFLARDSNGEISLGSKKLFLTQKRDYTGAGAMDIACDAKGIDLERKIAAWKKGEPIKDILGDHLNGFTMRAYYEGEMVEVQCSGGTLGKDATHHKVLKFIDDIKSGDSCYDTGDKGPNTKEDIQALSTFLEKTVGN